MTKTALKKYAKLIVKCGINLKRGQEVMITAEVDQPDFVKLVTEECYRAGAKKVTVDFGSAAIAALHAKYRKEDVLGTLEEWELKKWERQAEVIPCKIYLVSEDPDAFEGIDQAKYARAMAKRSKLIKPIRAKMENKYQWCIAAVPGKKWAEKIFPGVRSSLAEKMLWDAILSCSRVDDDPIKAWKEHNEDLAKRCDYLNSLRIKSLHITSSNGTDLTVGLIPDVLFMGGGEYALGSGIYYNPNIPSEEVFTSPMKGEAEGIVYSSRPLVCGGVLVEDFYVKFEGGKAVEIGAKKNADALRELIKMDENAAYLGEVALVPYSSPIRKSGLLFYNTLFDENAACHLALGRGFTNLVKGYEKLTEDECHAKGINDSIVHEDFMIGTCDTSVTAICEDGREVKIFEGGEWAF